MLGEHVGGSAVRSLCCVSKLHTISSRATNLCDRQSDDVIGVQDTPILLISVGAKRVLTSWILKNRWPVNNKDIPVDQQNDSSGDHDKFWSNLSSLTFQWLSTDMPAKYASTCKIVENNTKKVIESDENAYNANSGLRPGSMLPERALNVTLEKHEDDWRYLAVTAFHVKCAGSR